MDQDEVEVNGARVLPGFLNLPEQRAILEAIRAVLAEAPLVRPVTPSGRPMSVRMSAAGQFGWVTDRKGYRYEARHPHGMPWPPIPESVMAVWVEVACVERAPESCLINWYDAEARMGLHQDKDEADFTMPVVSISLGDDALFRVGGTERRGGTKSIWLRSGDVAVLAGPSRLAYHGVDRVRAGTSTLMPNGGRLNLTLRVVT